MCQDAQGKAHKDLASGQETINLNKKNTLGYNIQILNGQFCRQTWVKNPVNGPYPGFNDCAIKINSSAIIIYLPGSQSFILLIINLKSQKMKTSCLFFLVLILITRSGFTQKNSIDRYLALKPSEIRAGKPKIQQYAVTLKWQNLDAIQGNTFNCNAVKATYITGLENDSVSWKNVSSATISNFQQTEFHGTSLPSFDGFTYKINETNFLEEGFYATILPEHRDIAKWLVSDAIQMQGLAWYIFDSLKFNEPFVPKFLNNYDIKFKDWVTFTSRYQKLLWSGITKYQGEACAIVRFESLYNPLHIDNVQMSVKGRSLYYGEIWISLSDKQVEYASMVEDVVMKLKGPLFPEEQLIDLQREIIFKKAE